MASINVGMLFESYGSEFSRYDKYSTVDDPKRGFFRQGSIYTTKDKHVVEVNCFNPQNLSLDEMLLNNETIRFNYDRYGDEYGIHYRFEMNRDGLKYSGSNNNHDNNEENFTRIDAVDSYAIDLNKNGKVDEGEIFSKKSATVQSAEISSDSLMAIIEKFRLPESVTKLAETEIVPLDSPLGKQLSRSTQDYRAIDKEYEPVYSEPDKLGRKELIGYRKRSKWPKLYSQKP